MSGRPPRRLVTVKLGERSYDVVIGRGARHDLRHLLPSSARRAVVVTQDGIGVEVDPGIEHLTVSIEKGERAKSLASFEQLARTFAGGGLSRSDVVVAVGGGLVTDLAGFAAACWHRGTAVVHVATTLLAQVDAAVGGKTGVNLPEGKNLVGAFWQPHAVICDTETLDTLPPEEWRSGRGEMAKYACLGLELDGLEIEEEIEACVAMKADIVSRDEREGGLRAVLNYGHTLAHALEAAGFASDAASESSPPMRHGEAVAVGLVFAARLARAMGRIDDARVREHEEIVSRYGLPHLLPAGADPGVLVVLMGRDKKAHHDLTFVLDGPGGVETVHGVAPALVLGVLAEMRPR